MKTNLDSLFKTDKKLETEGVEFVLREAEGDSPAVLFRLRRFAGTNPRVKAAMARFYKPYARQVDMGTLAPEKELELNIKIFIDVSLVSWSGVSDENGKEIECTPENAYKLFSRLPDLFGTLQKYASEFESFKEDVGNS